MSSCLCRRDSVNEACVCECLEDTEELIRSVCRHLTTMIDRLDRLIELNTPHEVEEELVCVMRHPPD